jgi:transcriptional regulator with PAS, ATPase and Fis domain
MASERAFKPFVAVNCASLPHELIESELFGYAPGAFSGSNPRGMIGKFELADTGTIFLDEIGELPLSAQSKLLRALENGEIQKLGHSGTVYVNCRLIAATNKNLEQMVHDGVFRKDLFHRLNVLELAVPPLRKRLDDIPLLVDSHLKQLLGFKKADKIEISDEVMRLFQSYSWPGNVRELKNVLAFSLYAMDEQIAQIGTAHLPERFLTGVKTERKHMPAEPDEKPALESFAKDLHAVVARAERGAILAALARAGQNRSVAARELNVSRSTLYKKMVALGLSSAVPDR